MILTVATMKGGVGKTTTAVILAEMAAQRGFRTLLVDMDTQRNAYKKVMAETEEGRFVPIFDKLDAAIRDTEAPDQKLLTDYDLVVVDTRPEANIEIIRKTLAMSDAVVTPFQMGDDEITGVGELFELLPGDGHLLVFPLHVVSPMESADDKALEDDAADFFAEFGLARDAIMHWPMRKAIKNNLSRRRPFHFQLTEKDKDVYRRVFDTIMKELRRK